MSFAVKCTDRYFELVRQFPLVPLRTKRQYKAALRMIHQLTDEPLNLSQTELDYISVLGGLIADYEKILYPAEKVSGRDMLKFLMEQNEMTLTDLAREIGGHKSNLSAFLNRSRSLSKASALALAKRFGIAAEVFLQ